jgi:hypothetical protein
MYGSYPRFDVLDNQFPINRIIDSSTSTPEYELRVDFMQLSLLSQYEWIIYNLLLYWCRKKLMTWLVGTLW